MKRGEQVVRAELGCLHCGYDVGEVEGRRGALPQDLVFLPIHRGDRLLVDQAGRFRCPRCRGQVLVTIMRHISHPLDPTTAREATVMEECSRSS